MVDKPTISPDSATTQATVEPLWFRDVSDEAGLDITYRNGEEANRYTILESLGGGVAVLDYDRDGLLDVFATGGGEFEGDSGGKTRGLPGKLFRNLGGLRFQDVTAALGLDAAPFYSHGALAGDIDNDGWTDLLVTGYRGMTLYHNELAPDGNARQFRDVTEAWGLSDPRWCSSAAWGDLWGSGRLDLYVCRYLDWSESNDPVCPRRDDPTNRDVCTPQRFRPLAHSLYRNTGSRFEEVSDQIPLKAGKGLGIVITDLNQDQRPDVYVANDDGENWLYRNDGAGKFTECAQEAGVAVDDHGRYNGSMGVDVGDFDGSGRASILVTNFQGELPALYANLGDGQFLHQSQAVGLGAVGQSYVGFGVTLSDFDRDGWLDLAILNGHVVRYPSGVPFHQKPLLFHNQPRGQRRTFRPISTQGGEFFNEPALGRGLAAADLDNDGGIDLLCSRCNRRLTLLHNIAAKGQPKPPHWLGIELSRRDGRPTAGATVRIKVGERTLTQFVKSGGSYLSTSDPRVVFGLGSSTQVERVEVAWPWGEIQTWDTASQSLDRYWRAHEGGTLE
ncbi:MAG: CRTAC1 family protein [Pirellulales bacterium]